MSTNISTKPKLCLKLLLTLLVSIGLGTLLLVLAYCIPTDKIIKNTEASISTLNEEGLYPFVKGKYYSTLLDNWTDSIIYSESIYRSGNALRDAMLNPTIQFENIDPLTNLNKILNHQNIDSDGSIVDYPRYWHGNIVLAKPLLTICSIREIRTINTIVQIILIAIVLFLLYKKLNFLYACSFFGVIMMINPLVTGRSMQFSSIQYIMLFACIALLINKAKLFKNYRDIQLFFLIGICVAYFDFLTYPVASLGTPLLLTLSIKSNELKQNNQTTSKEFFSCTETLIADAAAWTIGYASMWSAKWLLATMLTGSNVFQDAMNQANFRVSGNVMTNSGMELGETALRNAALYRNFILVAETNTIPAFGIFIVLVMLLLIFKSYKLKIKLDMVALDIIIAIFPIVWYMILKNHSYIHFWMTYRNLTVMTYAAFMIIAESCNPRHHTGDSKIK